MKTPEEPSLADRERAFRGPRGERMYGMPDRRFSHDDAKDHLYTRTRRNADDAFEELTTMDTLPPEF